MKAPKRLQALIDEGLIDTVVRQLMSGKEAMVFVVRCGPETRCAKVYKEASQRSFRQAVDYTENRKVKNTRQARAMAKGTRFGREATEADRHRDARTDDRRQGRPGRRGGFRRTRLHRCRRTSAFPRPG